MRITIKADCNDGDYIWESTEITEAQLNEIRPVVEAIKKKGHHHNWVTGDHVTHEGSLEEQYPELSYHQIILFDNFVPYHENGTHCINSVQINEIKEILL